MRDDAGPASLEPLPRHHAVLEAEKRDERDVDHDGRADSAHRPAIDGTRNAGQVAHESDQVKESREKYAVSNDTEQQIQSPRHGCPSSLSGRAVLRSEEHTSALQSLMR